MLSHLQKDRGNSMPSCDDS